MGIFNPKIANLGIFRAFGYWGITQKIWVFFGYFWVFLDYFEKLNFLSQLFQFPSRIQIVFLCACAGSQSGLLQFGKSGNPSSESDFIVATRGIFCSLFLSNSSFPFFFLLLFQRVHNFVSC